MLLSITGRLAFFLFFFLNDTAPPEIYSLPLPDALPIFAEIARRVEPAVVNIDTVSAAPPQTAGKDGDEDNDDSDNPLLDMLRRHARRPSRGVGSGDRKSTRLNSSHSQISYAVFCLKKKK